MAVKIAKPDTHKRSYSFLELDNGLKAVVGSDPECDTAGAALCVNVGMCHEKKDLPGLAHFLEHMLFTGTKKFPKEGEYHEFIQQNGGMANAYTTCYFTNYMFEVKPDMLEQAVDRFSRFFSEPLLTRDCTDREINAVDSEFQAGLTSPWWRYVGIMNMSANPDHPFHVACGNNKVLKDEPKERGVDLYDEMKALYDATYSANGMTLCIVGKEDTPTLEAMVRQAFSGVPNKDITMPIGDCVSDKPPFLPKDWNRLLLQNPVKDVKELSFCWVIPYQAPNWKTKPSQYISHLLGYEGTGSVISVLKQKGLISGCTSGDGAWLEGAFSLMNVNFDLTDKGLSNLTEIGTHLFTFIGLLQKLPVEKWIAEEIMKLRKIQFKFGEDMGPFDLCPQVAAAMHNYPPSESLAGDTLVYDYDADVISSVLARLTLESVRVSHQAKCLADKCTEKDTSYDSPMAFLPLEAEWLEKWSAALLPGDGSAEAAVNAAAAMGLHLPKPNPFIPEDLSLRELPAEPPLLPVLLESSIPPVARIFHRQDDTFKQPKAYVTFQIYSPFAMQNVETCTAAEIWCRCVEEALSEFAYDAEVAGVKYSLALRSGAISLVVAGFNDKLSVLLSAVTEKMRSMAEVPSNVFDIVADAYGDEIRNTAFHSPPYSQCGMRFTELSTQGSSFPSYLRCQAFQSLKREDLSGMPDKLFEACHVEAVMLGNLNRDDAHTLAATLVKGLNLKNSLESLPVRAEARLPSGSTLWDLPSTDDQDPNHAVFLRIQIPESLEADMMLGLLSKVLGPKFFDILRTQQQLGYIVQLNNGAASKFCYVVAVIQSEFSPNYVRSRINSFLDDHFAFIANTLTEEEFQVCRTGFLSELKVKPKNLGEELGRYSKVFADRSFDFGRRQQSIDFIDSTVTLDSFRTYVREHVQTAPRLCTQVNKTMAKEDKPLPDGATVPEDPAELRKWNTHTETVKEFKSSAEWRAINSTP